MNSASQTNAEADVELIRRSKAADKERRMRFVAEGTNGERNRYRKALEAINIRNLPVFPAGIELPEKKAPSLMDMPLKVLSENSRSIQSLLCVPEHLRTKLSRLVGYMDTLDTRFVRLLMEGSPDEIFVENCNGMKENVLTEILCDCNRDKLEVLYLQFHGDCMTDKVIADFLKRSPNGFPKLRNLSLLEATGLTDKGLVQLLKSAPLLLYLNVTCCPLFTSHSVKILAERFGSSFKGLNIEECVSIRPDNVFWRSLIQFEKLTSLSVSGLRNFKDPLMSFMTIHGSHLTDLFLAHCDGFWSLELTDEFFWTIGAFCPKLETLDLGWCSLTENRLGGITDGCLFLKSVNLSGTPLSDQALAAFIEVSGSSLTHLYLCETAVREHFAISLGKVCQNLVYLDCSRCLNLSEEHLRWILKQCSSLKLLNVYGCDQVSVEFLEESNVLVKEWTRRLQKLHSPPLPHA